MAANPVQSWNAVIKFLIGTKEAWERHQALMQTYPNTDSYSIEAQKHITMSFNRMDFERALPLLISYIRSHGGYDGILMEIPKKPKEKKNAA